MDHGQVTVRMEPEGHLRQKLVRQIQWGPISKYALTSKLELRSDERGIGRGREAYWPTFGMDELDKVDNTACACAGW